MRTRTGFASAAFLVLGLGAGSASAQFQLRGSDTLEDVTKDAITAGGLTASLNYVGGGSGAGENAMIAGSQHISPMSRQLNSGVTDTAKCTATAQQLLIALDGLSIVAANPAKGDSLDQTADLTDNCSDTISAVTLGTVTPILKADGVTPCDANDGCATAGQYAFASWKEVLAMVYGGQNHNSGATVNAAGGAACVYSIDQSVTPANETGGDSACPAGQVCFPNNKCGDPNVVGKRNTARTNCMNPVRVFLANNYGSIFQDNGTLHTCRTGTCTTLRHAFRRDNLSGTTDAFDSLVGLPTIANPTKSFAQNSPMPDRQAAANPFCNAGDRPMNKGDADYLDLDPIRRSVDIFTNASNLRFGSEQVSEFDSPVFGGNNNDASCQNAAPTNRIPQDRGSTTEPGIWPDPNIAGSQAALAADLGSNGVAPGSVARSATTRTCLGLVLPITLPANYATVQQAYFADSTNTPVTCDVNSFAFTTPDGQHPSTALCPNGTPQPCLLPFHLDPTLPPPSQNFNCISDQLSPAPTGIGGQADRRNFNLHPSDTAGHYVRDNYINPVICSDHTNLTLCPTANPILAPIRQGRVVSAYYRLNTTRTTTGHGSVPTGGPCTALTSTDQIGCLVKANSCTIGFAGREAVDDILLLGQANIGNFAFQIEGIRPTTINVQNFASGGTPVYPITRGLYLNSIVGFASPLVTAAETALFNFESVTTNIDPIVTARNFTLVPAAVTNRLKACPAVFP